MAELARLLLYRQRGYCLAPARRFRASCALCLLYAFLYDTLPYGAPGRYPSPAPALLLYRMPPRYCYCTAPCFFFFLPLRWFGGAGERRLLALNRFR